MIKDTDKEHPTAMATAKSDGGFKPTSKINLEEVLEKCKD